MSAGEGDVFEGTPTEVVQQLEEVGVERDLMGAIRERFRKRDYPAVRCTSKPETCDDGQQGRRVECHEVLPDGSTGDEWSDLYCPGGKPPSTR